VFYTPNLERLTKKNIGVIFQKEFIFEKKVLVRYCELESCNFYLVVFIHLDVVTQFFLNYNLVASAKNPM